MLILFARSSHLLCWRVWLLSRIFEAVVAVEAWRKGLDFAWETWPYLARTPVAMLLLSTGLTATSPSLGHTTVVYHM